MPKQAGYTDYEIWNIRDEKILCIHVLIKTEKCIKII
jgi:hypothetical protein